MALCLRSASIALLCSTALIAAVYSSFNNNKDHLNHARQLTALPSFTDPKTVALRSRDPITNINTSTYNEWPMTEMPRQHPNSIPEGTYVFSGTGTHQTTNGNIGHVLLYITSHMSQQHEMFLKYCWPNILARSALLREADVAVYLNPEVEKRNNAMNLLKDTFAGQNLKVYLRSKNVGTTIDPNQDLFEEKTKGANMAMYEAVTSNFFSGYDWIIRLNPDVIVRDDSFLIQSMADPSKVSALLINCAGFMHAHPKVHTDFFVIKPAMLLTPGTDANAERVFTASITESVLKKGSHRWIPNTNPRAARCRAGYGRDFFESPIVHEHVLHPDICSVPSDVDISAVFPAPWPLSWSTV